MKRPSLFSILTIAISVAALAFFFTTGFAAQPHLHGAGLGAGGSLAMAAAYGSFEYWRPLRAAQKHPAAKPNFVIAATSPDFPNGIMGAPLPGSGLVKLFAFESLRAQCENSADPKLLALAGALPHYWAFDPVIDDPSYTLTDQQKFNIVTNCAHATVLSGYELYYASPTMNTPDTSGMSRWIEGEVIADAGALPTALTLNDLPALAQRFLS